jgi:phosphatidate cytidylyltransferase
VLARERIVAMRVWWRLAYLAVPIHYLFILLASGAGPESFGPVWTFIPVWVFFIMLVRLVVTGQTHGFLETAGITFVGLMLIVFLLSHAVLLLALKDSANPVAGGVGLFLYLVVLTEGNDIAQALWGRQLGRHKITPRVSPGKTWEGFLLGAATTVALACLLAPYLTPYAATPYFVAGVELNVPYLPALATGAMIAVGGFLGDITMSAAKRDAGVKDTGTLLPGQGGVLDRVDSLMFTAPLFFYFNFALFSVESS